MTCAACDDCPADSWHLHVTVMRNSARPVAQRFADLCSALACRPTRVTNRFYDGSARDYEELIPTRHVQGDWHVASASLADLAAGCALHGWEVLRSKAEINIRAPLAASMPTLYAESHLRLPLDVRARLALTRAGWGISQTERRPLEIIGTCRQRTTRDLRDRLMAMQYALAELGIRPLGPARMEQAVADSAEHLDAAWLGQPRPSTPELRRAP